MVGAGDASASSAARDAPIVLLPGPILHPVCCAKNWLTAVHCAIRLAAEHALMMLGFLM